MATINFPKRVVTSAVTTGTSPPIAAPKKSNIIPVVQSTSVDKLRAILVGYPNSGKTRAALSFPNPVVIDFDHKLPSGYPTFPFYEASWVKATFPHEDHTKGIDRKNSLIEFLRKNLPSLEGYSVILDSWTLVMSSFTAWARANRAEFQSKLGNDMPLKVFGEKLDYSAEVISLLCGHPGHVIVTAHAQMEYNDDGKPTGMLKPFTTGSFKDVMRGYFNTSLLVEYSPKLETRFPETKGHVFVVEPTAMFKPMLPPDVGQPSVDRIPATYDALCKLISDTKISPPVVEDTTENKQ